MKREIIDKIVNYFKNKPIIKAWLFGSVSRGEDIATSDVDILVELDQDSHIGMRFFGMINDLEIICNRKVDLVASDMLDQHIVSEINKDKILIYAR